MNILIVGGAERELPVCSFSRIRESESGTFVLYGYGDLPEVRVGNTYQLSVTDYVLDIVPYAVEVSYRADQADEMMSCSFSVVRRRMLNEENPEFEEGEEDRFLYIGSILK